MADLAEDLRVVFAYACQGRLPEDVEGEASELVQYLTAAAKLKALRLPSDGPVETAAPLIGTKRTRAAAVSSKGNKGRRRQPAPSAAAGPTAAPATANPPAAARASSGQQASAVVVMSEPEAVEAACAAVRKFRFGHEHIGDSRLLRQPELWSAMLEVGMPTGALVRNLGRLTALGVLGENSAHVEAVVTRLTSEAAVKAARLHPIALLDALRVYESGHGDKGKLKWQACPPVSAALERAFYLAFKNVEATGQRFLLGLDVSGSMDGAMVCGLSSLTAREVVGALAMALMRSEAPENVRTMAFQNKLVPLALRREMKLVEVLKAMRNLPFGPTDCAQPMLYALENKIPVDVFVVMTDNETWCGGEHPTQALQRYRKEMDLPGAKLVVLATSVTSFSIADPEDPGMLDIAGCDSAVPRIISEFVLGRI